MNIEQLRNYLLERISDLEQNEFTREWIADVRQAKKHLELINDR